MLSHPNIKIMLNTDTARLKRWSRTGDDLHRSGGWIFDRYGKLPYRSLIFSTRQSTRLCINQWQSWTIPTSIYTPASPSSNTWPEEHTKTSIVYEYPREEGDPYYPVPRPENAELYKKYKALAEAKGVHFVGRLATYKYFTDRGSGSRYTINWRYAAVNLENVDKKLASVQDSLQKTIV